MASPVSSKIALEEKTFINMCHRCILVPVMDRGGIRKKTFFKCVASQKWGRMQRLLKALAGFTVCYIECFEV